MPEALIVDAVRTGTGKGKDGGALSTWHPADLLASVLRDLVSRNDLDPSVIDDVIGGCVSQVGQQSLNVTRTAVLGAGFPESVPATTVDRQCGSSQQAVHFAAQAIRSGEYDVVIACGVESMSRVRMLSSVQGGDPQGELIRRRYPQGLVPQGVACELIASEWNLKREELDMFAYRSHSLAKAAWERGDFSNEIVSVQVNGTDFMQDETVRATSVESLAALEPAFPNQEWATRFPDMDWKLTSGNSSPLSDGASATLLVSEAAAERFGLNVRARVHSMAVSGSDPYHMLTGVLPATEKLLSRTNLKIHDIDVYEINEAFAPVPIIWQQHFNADMEKVNPNGGAIALGHPLGASGTRIMATMLNALEARGGRLALQTMCEYGGMANALVIERV